MGDKHESNSARTNLKWCACKHEKKGIGEESRQRLVLGHVAKVITWNTLSSSKSLLEMCFFIVSKLIKETLDWTIKEIEVQRTLMFLIFYINH